LIEKHIVLEDIDPVMFYGVGNVHLQMLRALYPKLRIVGRDNVLRIMGDEEQMAAFEESSEKLRQHILKFNAITEEDILDIVKGKRANEKLPDDVVVYSIWIGKLAQTVVVLSLLSCFFHEWLQAQLGFPLHVYLLWAGVALTLTALAIYTVRALAIYREVRKKAKEK